jgi:hypothetical protein
MLSEQLLEKCEEFFDLVAIEHRTAEVSEIIEQVTVFLVDEIDGHTSQADFVVAEEVEIQIKSLWDLLPMDEKCTNNNLRDYYDDLLETLSGVLDVPNSEFDGGDSDDYDWDSDDSAYEGGEDYE